MTRENIENSFLYGANTAFIEELYQRYLKNPASVDGSWQQFFKSLGDPPAHHPSWEIEPTKIIGQTDGEAAPAKTDKKTGAAPVDAKALQTETLNALRAQALIRAYRVRGHLMATLDPLGIEKPQMHADLDPTTYGFTDADHDRVIFLGGNLGKERATLREILEILQTTYAGTIGVEFMHIQDPAQREWIQKRIEAVHGAPQLEPGVKKKILKLLLEVEAFEEFTQLKYTGVKRFSVQGGDAMVPGMLAVLETAAQEGVQEIVIGMPHRGRMNVLTAIMGKPYSELLSIFNGNLDFPDSVDVSGDVKYHIGASQDRVMANGKTMHLSLTANPSHLEAVNPVVVGKVRAKQDQRNDEERKQVMGILLHGDAAFAGQGLVPETLALADLRGYRTGGTVHIVVNNQIGFTTAPKYSRFTPYPTDCAKTVQSPIFHVNGDDPEAVVFCCQLATEFRQKFGRDTVVDIFCYRKYGHNEGDEPMYTQPIMYKTIATHPLPARIYAARLIEEGLMKEEDIGAEMEKLNAFFQKEYEAGKVFKPNKANWLEGKWTGFAKAEHGLGNKEPDTGVDPKKLKAMGIRLAQAPAGFNLIRKLDRQLKAKVEMMETGNGLDWAMGEALGFASLLAEKHHVRLTGQDSGRGTFSHRQSVFVDQETEDRYLPLNHIADEQAGYEVHDSNLSEFAVLGFEYGYSLAEPEALVLWEAQFGDFANGAQVIIDQFIASGEVKWLRMSGLIMLLPHGYEGQGPEHSSARLERFLQLCGGDNMQVVNCTTPANFFHALRRQLARKFRKPLIVMTPKSLLRHKLAVSSLKDFALGTSFTRVYGEVDPLASDSDIKRVILTSGKVYYDLLEARREKKINDVALVRVEQYYPFPQEEILAVLTRYKNAEVAWCQEEPENMGAWRFIGPRIGDVMESLGKSARIRYIGRKEAASPAAGYKVQHDKEQAQLIEDAFVLPEQEAKQRKKA